MERGCIFVRSNKYAQWSGLSSLDIDHIGASLSEECGVRSEELNASPINSSSKSNNSSLLTPRSSLKNNSSLKVSDDCCRFAQFIAQYTLDEQMRLFGEQFKQASESNSKSVYGTNNQELLDSLLNVFTIKDMQKIRDTSANKRSLYQIVKRWTDNELIVRHDSHSWKRT